MERLGTTVSMQRHRLEDGSTVLLSVAESGVTAVFFGVGGEEVGGTPVRPLPGQVVEVRP